MPTLVRSPSTRADELRPLRLQGLLCQIVAALDAVELDSAAPDEPDLVVAESNIAGSVSTLMKCATKGVTGSSPPA